MLWGIKTTAKLSPFIAVPSQKGRGFCATFWILPEKGRGDVKADVAKSVEAMGTAFRLLRDLS